LGKVNPMLRVSAVVFAILLLLSASLLPCLGETALEAETCEGDGPAPTLAPIEATPPADLFPGYIDGDESNPFPASRSLPYGAWDHDEPPVARSGSGMVYDPIGDDIYLFGGFPIMPSNDLWRYDISTSTWTELIPPDSPANRTNFGMAFDTTRNEIVIWGGLDMFYSCLNDMWRYNTASGIWTEVVQTSRPSIRYSMSMVYSENLDALFMYGGLDNSINHVYNQLWKFDISSGAWSVAGALDGIGRFGYGMDLDQNNDTLYIYGGWNYTVGIVGDLLEVDLNNASNYWKYTPGANPGLLREPVVACLNEVSGVSAVYIYGGYDGISEYRSEMYAFSTFSKTFSYVGNYTTSAPNWPSGRESTTYCFKHSNDRLFIFSGRDGNGYLQDMWYFDHSSQGWTQAYNVVARPDSREGTQLVTSLENKRMYLFGGFGYTLFDDTWYYDLVTEKWNQVTTTTSPLARFGYSAAYDPVGGGIYLFGGINWYTTDQVLQDLWYFDMGTQDWSLKSVSGSAPGNRSFSGAVVDPENGELYIYGGQWGSYMYNDIWKYDPFGSSWSEVNDINAPIKRSAQGMALDPNGGGFFVFAGGYDDGGGIIINNELWRYDFTTKTWTQKTGPQPPHMWHGKLCSGEDKLFLFGGYTIGFFNLQNDIYVYNISQGFWSKVAKTGSVPYPRTSMGLEFDPWERDVYVFSGYGSSGGLWHYGLPYDLDLDLNFTEGPVCYARHQAYDFKVTVDHGLSYDLLDKVNFVIDPNDLNITVEYRKSSDDFTMIGASGPHIDYSQSAASHDGNKAWDIHFKLDFAWSFPKADLLDVEIGIADSNGFTAKKGFSEVFRVETEVEYQGSLEVSGEHHGSINSGAVLKSGESVHWGGVKVVYKDTTDKYPPDDEFDVVVFDDDGDFWMDSSSSGRNISIDSTVDLANDVSDIHYVNLSGEASNNNVLSLPFGIGVDIQGVTITDLKPEGDAWLRQSSVTFTAKVSDQGGLVNASSIQYNLSSVGKWTSAGMDTDEAVIDASVKLTLDEGIHTLRWRATDQAGNTPVVSPDVQVKIDTIAPTIIDHYPKSGVKVDSKTIITWIHASDTTSAIPANGVEYQLSTDNGTTYSDWTPLVTAGGNDVNASINLNLTEGNVNRLNWRVLDTAGNIIKILSPVHIAVELPVIGQKIPSVTLLTPDNHSVIKTLTPSFTWSGSDYSGTDEVLYNLYLGINNNPQESTPEARNLVKASHTLTYALTDGTTYYWTVHPVVNGKEGSCVSGVFSFTTSYLVDLDRSVIMTLDTENMKIVRGESYNINLTLSNTGEITEEITLILNAADNAPDMVTLDTNSLTIMPGNQKVVVVTIEPAEDCPTEIFVYTITGDYKVNTVSKELTLVVETGEATDDDDDDTTDGSGALLAAILIIILLLALVIIVVVVVLMRRKKTTTEEPASAEADVEEKPRKKKDAPKVETREEPIDEEEEYADPLDEIDAMPYTLESSDAIDPEMDDDGDIFTEAAYHKGYDAAKKQIGGDEDVLEIPFPPEDQLSMKPGPERTQIKDWDMPGLDPTNMPGVGAPILALPPAVFLDMEDAGEGKAYRVEEILIMDPNGILLTHFSRGSSLNVDEDILAGMITAIQSFVKESFSTGGKGLSDLAMGDFRIFISQGDKVTFVAMVSGENFSTVKKQLDKAVLVTEKEFATQLHEWSGDVGDMVGMEHIIRDFLDGKFE